MKTATYSPEDNKLRLYSTTRLGSEDYARVRAAGFRWAPRQELFVAPAWTPAREDLLIELCGEIGDEDSSLVDRAEERAERFGEYSEKREAEAHQAKDAVDAIANGIPLGQPILVGHHSERRARKDAEKITDGMRRAVRLWQTATYWTDRAAGAIRHAKYLERPDVRHRRIERLEADKRKDAKRKKEAEAFLSLWTDPEKELTQERARAIANRDHVSRCFPLADYPRELPASQYEGQMSLWSALEGIITPEQAREIAVVCHTRIVTRCDRWLEHLGNRLAYERAMLGEAGGIAADKWELKVGGQVRDRFDEWATITKLNCKDGRIVSVSTNACYIRVKGVETIRDYRPPTEEQTQAAGRANKLPPLVNYPGDGFQAMTKAEWKRKPRDYKSTQTQEATAERGAYRYRSAFVSGGSFRSAPVFLTDAKVVLPPAAGKAAAIPDELPREVVPWGKVRQPAKPSEFDQMAESLRQGVTVVSAPQLFETPPDLAARMVELAKPGQGDRILEPSAGTGRILAAILKRDNCAKVQAVEINLALADSLRERWGRGNYNVAIRCCDFLAQDGNLGEFDRILMNPPFRNGEDIKHILHARGMLAPGGWLVAICANGSRQQAKLMPEADEWEELPEGTFAGTNVRAALLVMSASE